MRIDVVLRYVGIVMLFIAAFMLVSVLVQLLLRMYLIMQWLSEFQLK